MSNLSALSMDALSAISVDPCAGSAERAAAYAEKARRYYVASCNPSNFCAPYDLNSATFYADCAAFWAKRAEREAAELTTITIL